MINSAKCLWGIVAQKYPPGSSVERHMSIVFYLKGFTNPLLGLKIYIQRVPEISHKKSSTELTSVAESDKRL